MSAEVTQEPKVSIAVYLMLVQNHSSQAALYFSTAVGSLSWSVAKHEDQQHPQ
jgi:hypothetical protein